jgi:hypothetical protein
MGSEWILGRCRWRTLVNTIMNLRVLAPRSWLVILKNETIASVHFVSYTYYPTVRHFQTMRVKWYH